MKFCFLVAMLGVSLLIHSPVLAEKSESSELTNKEALLLYSELKDIRSFGMIAVSLLGDSEKIGLNETDLTNEVKSNFKKYFGGMKFEDISKDSKRFLTLVSSRDRTVGNITIRVWVVGHEFPVVYHVRCDAGNFVNPSIWTEEILGHGSQASAPEAIKEILDEMIKLLAVAFLKVTGHPM